MSTQHYHAILWIDHHQARVIHFNATEADGTLIHPSHPPRHLHSKAGSASGTHQHGDKQFFDDAAEALKGCHAFIVVGPSKAKEEFVTYLEQNHRDLVEKLDSVKAMEQVTDNQLVAVGRRHFKAADRMRAQIG
jgi:stalled ribosome rescue protein Dom34